MLYHLSKNKNLTVLTPKIPESAIPTYEDIKTKRVCFSDFIDGCLSALQDVPSKYYVYVPIDELSEDDVYHPTVDEVIDAEFTHEVWILKEIKVKCIGIIQNDNYNWCKKYSTDKGNATFFHYSYKWIEKL